MAKAWRAWASSQMHRRFCSGWFRLLHVRAGFQTSARCKKIYCKTKTTVQRANISLAQSTFSDVFVNHVFFTSKKPCLGVSLEHLHSNEAQVALAVPRSKDRGQTSLAQSALGRHQLRWSHSLRKKLKIRCYSTVYSYCSVHSIPTKNRKLQFSALFSETLIRSTYDLLFNWLLIKNNSPYLPPRRAIAPSQWLGHGRRARGSFPCPPWQWRWTAALEWAVPPGGSWFCCHLHTQNESDDSIYDLLWSILIILFHELSW